MNILDIKLTSSLWQGSGLFESSSKHIDIETTRVGIAVNAKTFQKDALELLRGSYGYACVLCCTNSGQGLDGSAVEKSVQSLKP